jgi:hypothetical protein
MEPDVFEKLKPKAVLARFFIKRGIKKMQSLQTWFQYR